MGKRSHSKLWPGCLAKQPLVELKSSVALTARKVCWFLCVCACMGARMCMRMCSFDKLLLEMWLLDTIYCLPLKFGERVMFTACAWNVINRETFTFCAQNVVAKQYIVILFAFCIEIYWKMSCRSFGNLHSVFCKTHTSKFIEKNRQQFKVPLPFVPYYLN